MIEVYVVLVLPVLFFNMTSDIPSYHDNSVLVGPYETSCVIFVLTFAARNLIVPDTIITFDRRYADPVISS